MLKLGRDKAEYIEAAKHLRCAACATSKRPTLARPAKPPGTYEFNSTIGLDIFYVQGPEKGSKVPMLNLVCHGIAH